MKRQAFIKNSFTHMQKIAVTTLRIVCNLNYVKLLSPICLFLFCLSCGNKKETEFDGQSLAGTKWKLAGIVDTQTGTLTVLDPKDCDSCYSFTFDTDSTASGNSITNVLLVRLNAEVPIVIATEVADCHIGNCSLFYNAIQLIISYELKNNELKFYYNDNKNYLLFKR